MSPGRRFPVALFVGSVMPVAVAAALVYVAHELIVKLRAGAAGPDP
jgi:hypothetical protein